MQDELTSSQEHMKFTPKDRAALPEKELRAD